MFIMALMVWDESPSLLKLYFVLSVVVMIILYFRAGVPCEEFSLRTFANEWHISLNVSAVQRSSPSSRVSSFLKQ